MIMDTTNSTSGVQSLQKQGIGLLTMLALEYLLGIVTTLFVAFPENAAEDELWKFAMTQPILIVHMILALLIVFAGALLVEEGIPYWIHCSFNCRGKWGAFYCRAS
jgi:hypothetical protein